MNQPKSNNSLTKIASVIMVVSLVVLLLVGSLQAEEPTPGDISSSSDSASFVSDESAGTDISQSETTTEEAAASQEEGTNSQTSAEESSGSSDSTEATDLTSETLSANAGSSGDNNPDDSFNLTSSASNEDISSAQLSLPGGLSSANTNTGAGSINTTTTEIDNQADVTNENYATVINYSLIKAETGKNKANYNTGSGVITSQDAKGQGELINVINKNVVQPDDGGQPNELGAGNQNTGANSTNQAFTNLNNQLTVKNINSVDAINQVDAQVSSGQNEANYNTGHGIILSGDADLGLNFISLANTNLVGSQKFYASWQNVFSSWSGDVDLSQEAAANNLSPLSDLLIEAANKSTGAGSTNQAIVNVNDQVSVTNQNSGKLNNEIKAEVVSGRNQANANTGTGSVTSGKANSAINALNFLNSNITASNWWLKNLNVFGNWSGNILLPAMPKPNLNFQFPSSGTAQNSQTGFNSVNNASTTIENSLALSNDNQAVITNEVRVRAITGENKTSYNGGSGIVKYGTAKAETNELNVANLNVTGDSWWLVVVNTFGSWAGTTVGSPADVVVKATENAKVLSPAGSGLEATNNSTGPNSNNSAGVNISHSTDAANVNQAEVFNKIELAAISGENEAQFNTGHGYVDSGDIRTSNNLVNFANANIAVGNWLVVVVNVFGNWVGNLVFNTVDNQISSQDLGSQSFDGSSSAANQSTGANSSNSANTSTSNNTNVTNNNSAEVANNASGTSSTGENSASYNTGSGVVTTGEASTNVNINNQINTNTTTLSGDSAGAGSSSNQNTGAGSDNNSSAASSNNTNVTNINTVTANNNVSANNSTGQNNANYNTGNGLVDTGWADTYLGLYNQYNDNTMTMDDLMQDFEGNVGGESNSAGSSADSAAGGSGVASGSESSTGSSENNSGTAAATTDSGNSFSGQSSSSSSQDADNSSAGNSSASSSDSGNESSTTNTSSSSSDSSSQSSSNNNVQNQSNANAATAGGGGGGGAGNPNANYYQSNSNQNVQGLGLNGQSLALQPASNTSKKTIKGDLNGDGKVNDYDFSILLANWGRQFKDKRADANGDGRVDDYDFSIVMSNWNKALAVLN